MGASTNVAPVIIKRKKVIVAGGHHGGAWKVAYADFVTAMMAFFMLMWLLNATTEKQRKGLADYFAPSVPISRVSGGGDGAFGGTNMFTEEELLEDGSGASQKFPQATFKSPGATIGDSVDEPEFDKIEEMLTARGGESMVTSEALKHIVTRVTDEGLIIEMFALDGAPLFEEGTSDPTPLFRDVIGMVSRVIGLVTNDIAITGHIRAHPVVLARNPVWELSAAQADRARQLLESAGTAAGRMSRVTGHADRKPVLRNTMSNRNNRVEVVLLRSDKG